MNEESLSRTPLFHVHQELGGKIIGFAGWELPVRYTGIIDEHHAVRQKAGLFDVSHMGEFLVTGKQAEEFLNYCTCNNVAKLVDGKAHYNAFINEQGGVVDDLIIYRFGPEEFFLCVNAANTAKDFEYLLPLSENFDVQLSNLSDKYAQIALQGPESEKILSKLFSIASEIKYFHFARTQLDASEVIIARTGYTGEDGYEIFVELDQVIKLYTDLIEVGQPHGLVPVGLGARDSLRLEACYPLHGHELADDITAIESGLSWITKLKKGDFIGRSVLEEHKNNGPPRSLVGFTVEDPGIVREQTKLFDSKDQEIGYVTSGTKSPTLNKALGLALIKTNSVNIGDQVFADVRGKKRSCVVCPTPFYKRSK